MISILMPVYNTPIFWLNECFTSIDNQTFQNFEVVIVNDGSTNEDTLQKLFSVENKYKIINIEKNKGIAIALNCGLKQCEYDYIARIDSDDIMKPTRLEIQYKYMIDNPSVDVSSVNMTFLRLNENNIWIESTDPFEHPNIITKEYAKTHDWFLNHPGTMYKKNSVLSLGGYNENINGLPEDFDLWMRMLKNNMILHNISQRLNVYRFNANSYTSVNGLTSRYQEHIKRLQDEL